MKSQLFKDENKRTCMIVVNKILNKNSCGINSIRKQNINEFYKFLTLYSF